MPSITTVPELPIGCKVFCDLREDGSGYEVVSQINCGVYTGLYEAFGIDREGNRLPVFEEHGRMVIKLASEEQITSDFQKTYSGKFKSLRPYILSSSVEIAERVSLSPLEQAEPGAPDLSTCQWYVWVMQIASPLTRFSLLETDPKAKEIQFLKRTLSIIKGMTALHDIGLIHGDPKIETLLELGEAVVMGELGHTQPYNESSSTIQSTHATYYTASKSTYCQLALDYAAEVQEEMVGSWDRFMRELLAGSGGDAYTFKSDEYATARTIQHLACMTYVPHTEEEKLKRETLPRFAMVGGFDLEMTCGFINEIERGRPSNLDDDQTHLWICGMRTKLKKILSLYDEFDSSLTACVDGMPELPVDVRKTVMALFQIARSPDLCIGGLIPTIEEVIRDLETPQARSSNRSCPRSSSDSIQNALKSLRSLSEEGRQKWFEKNPRLRNLYDNEMERLAREQQSMT